MLKLIGTSFNHAKDFVRENSADICELHREQQLQKILNDAHKLFAAVSFNPSTILHVNCPYEVKNESPSNQAGRSLNSTVQFVPGEK